MPIQSSSPLKLRDILHRRPSSQPDFSISDNIYTVKIARSDEELDAALRLRFDIFNLELGEGLDASYVTLRDEDQFDRQCDHLLIIDNATKNVIGTYRLQTREMAEKGNGFYSDGEFRLEMLGKKLLKNSVELGRACISRDFRNTRVLFLLWRGIANYLEQTKKRYLFGCGSLTSQNGAEGIALYKELIAQGNVDTSIKLLPQPGFELPVNDVWTGRHLVMPPLMKMYFRYGAKIVGEPAIDREFKTIDYLVLLDVGQMARETYRLFLGK